MDPDTLMRDQLGVISRRQVLELGGNDNLIECRVRRNEWRAVHRGVYVDHTGVPSDEQLQMAAVLHAWPAALAGESALLAHGVRNMRVEDIRIAIDATRKVRPPTGVSLLRLTELDDRVLWNRTPPRLRLEDAALETASRRWVQAGETAAVAVLADICQQRLSIPLRLREAMESHPRLRGRAFLLSLLDDVATGTFSVLEHRYLTRVERAHGLPRAKRQRAFKDEARSGFRDVHYVEQRVLVELDGRLGHEFAADQWADLERDVAAAGDELMTIRLGWGPVVSACRAARLMGRLLQARGWRGQVRECPDCARDTGNAPAPGAGDLPSTG
jgi:hypothetical protein